MGNVGSVDIEELKRAREALNQERGIETDPNMYDNYNPNRAKENADNISNQVDESETSETVESSYEQNDNNYNNITNSQSYETNVNTENFSDNAENASTLNSENDEVSDDDESLESVDDDDEDFDIGDFFEKILGEAYETQENTAKDSQPETQDENDSDLTDETQSDNENDESLESVNLENENNNTNPYASLDEFDVQKNGTNSEVANEPKQVKVESRPQERDFSVYDNFAEFEVKGYENVNSESINEESNDIYENQTQDSETLNNEISDEESIEALTESDDHSNSDEFLESSENQEIHETSESVADETATNEVENSDDQLDTVESSEDAETTTLESSDEGSSEESSALEKVSDEENPFIRMDSDVIITDREEVSKSSENTDDDKSHENESVSLDENSELVNAQSENTQNIEISNEETNADENSEVDETIKDETIKDTEKVENSHDSSILEDDSDTQYFDVVSTKNTIEPSNSEFSVTDELDFNAEDTTSSLNIVDEDNAIAEGDDTAATFNEHDDMANDSFSVIEAENAMNSEKSEEFPENEDISETSEKPNIDFYKKIKEYSFVDVLETEEFKSNDNLSYLFGKDEEGRLMFMNMRDMFNTAIFGTNEQAIFSHISSMLLSLSLKNNVNEVNFVICDSKLQSDFEVYNKSSYMFFNRVAKTNREILDTLAELENELEQRYNTLVEVGAKNIEHYNKSAVESDMSPLPYIIIVFNNYTRATGLMLGEQINICLTNLLKLGRIVGIYAVVSASEAIENQGVNLNLSGRIAYKTESEDLSNFEVGTSDAVRLADDNEFVYTSVKGDEIFHLKTAKLTKAETDLILENLEN